jgi:segregation and condensation protein B
VQSAHPSPQADDMQQDDTMDDAGAEAGQGTIVTLHPHAERSQHLRIIEAILFAATEPVSLAKFKEHLPDSTDVEALLADLADNYANRGVNLVQIAGKYMFRTAADVGFVLRKETTEQKRLTKAGLETLAIIAYHQPTTRADIEDIRGVAISKGTLDTLLDIGWIKMRGRRKTPGRPVTYGTTEAFMNHFGLNDITDLPGLQELKAAGLLEGNLPPGFDVPVPRTTDELTAEEDPLDGTEETPLEMHLPDPDAPVVKATEDVLAADMRGENADPRFEPDPSPDDEQA